MLSMNNLTTIQNIDPGRAIRKLILKPYGTYILRRSTPNDEILTQIQINQETNPNTSPRAYVVLSVRVDEREHKHTVLHYRLLSSGIDGRENRAQLLEQYHRLKNNLSFKKLTPLKKELQVRTEGKNWRIDRNNIEKPKDSSESSGKHNAGIFATIFKFPKENKVKIILKRFETEQDSYFNREFELLKELSFHHIVTLYGQYSHKNYNYLVLADGGKSLASLSPNPLSSDLVANFGLQIANGMAYLEKKNIVHRDLQTSNVLLDQYGFVRIADFGHAIKKDPTQEDFRPTQNDLNLNFWPRICAPECMPSPWNYEGTTTDSLTKALHNNFSSKSDVWAFGLLLIQLLIGQNSILYPQCKDECELIQYVKVNGQHHEEPPDCPMYHILERCWISDPNVRISFIDVRQELLTFICSMKK